MVFTEVGVNYLAVLISAIAIMVVGALWYSPLLFGNLWIKLMGYTKKDMSKAKNKGMTKEYIIAFVASLVTACVLATLIKSLAITTFLPAMQLACWVWLGFVVTTLVNSVLWEGRSWKVFLINIGHYFVALHIAAWILVIWA